MKKLDTTMPEVNFILDASQPATLDPDTQARLDALQDHDIDTSDIPDQSAATNWYAPQTRHTENKTQVTLRLDQEVLAFFKEQGPRYQIRINAVLRQYVQAHSHR
jgi:uncharacterized protein (DUF4415 family)